VVDMSRIDFTGKTLLVTGPNGGIGRETAIQFRAAGANVVMGEHTVDLDHDFATTLDPTGEHVLSFHLEAGSSASNDAFVAAAVAGYYRENTVIVSGLPLPLTRHCARSFHAITEEYRG